MNDYIIRPEWPVTSDIRAVTTLRAGGYSRGAFSSMNPASHVGDNPLAVLRNRKRLIECLNLPAEPIWLNQTHGRRVIDAGSLVERSADASFTFERRIVCVVLTADCLPVLLCNPVTGVVAAVHAGWRGLLLGVIEAALDVIGETRVAWLGPAIGPSAFVVGSEVRESFLEKAHFFASAFEPANENKWSLDLYSVARTILSRNGVRFIGGGEWCTYSDPERFFSYRRDGICGRLATMIWRE